MCRLTLHHRGSRRHYWPSRRRQIELLPKVWFCLLLSVVDGLAAVKAGGIMVLGGGSSAAAAARAGWSN